MPITSAHSQSIIATLYEHALKTIAKVTNALLRQTQGDESSDNVRTTLTIMLQSTDTAKAKKHLVSSCIGIPVVSIKLGTGARIDSPLRQGIVDGFADLVVQIRPPILRTVPKSLT